MLLLLPELKEETHPASAALVFQVFLLVGLGLVVLYVGETIPWVIEHQSDPTSDGLMARDNQLRREWSLM